MFSAVSASLHLRSGVSVGTVGVPLTHSSSELSDVSSYLRDLVVEEEAEARCVRAYVFACTCVCGRLCEEVSCPLQIGGMHSGQD